MHDGAYFSLLECIKCPHRDIFPLLINVGLGCCFSVKIKISLGLVYGVNVISKGILMCVRTCMCVVHLSLLVSVRLAVAV